MLSTFGKRVIILSLIIIVLVLGVFVFFKTRTKPLPTPSVVEVAILNPVHTIIGESVQGRKIDAYTYGTGKTHIAFVGGIHGGYEWNSVLLAYEFMDYLDANPKFVPDYLTITVVPSANPDGVYKVVNKEGRFSKSDVSTNKVILATGRFNADDVDLNRNFDCKWQPKSTWQNKIVSAGTTAFSEPEAEAIKNYVYKDKPSTVIFWHSQSGTVYASQCENGILPETLKLIDIYGKASGYKVSKTFDAYATTGGADDWLAAIGVPAFTVELTTHDGVEWDKNFAGIKAILERYK
ncbi:MAG: M14 family metallopeptidase [Minisyncoccia bacterium]